MKKTYIAPKATVVTMETNEIMIVTSATDSIGYGEYSKKKNSDWDFEDEEF